MQVERVLARNTPCDVGHVDHAVDVVVEADEQTEFGRVLDFAFDGRTDRMRGSEGLPRIGLSLLEAERDATLLGIDFEDHDVDFLRGRHDLARMDVLLGPGHFRHVDEAFDARFQLDERTIFGDVRDAAGELRADRILDHRAIPGIALQLLHAEADALGVLVDADDLHLDGVADVQDFARVTDALVAEIGDVQQAIDAAEINERTVIGDVLDDAVDDLALGQAQDQARTLLCARLFENGATRHDDVAALAVHLQDLERLGNVHQRGDVAHGADVDLRTGKERDGAVQVDGEATLHAAEDHALDAGRLREFGFQLVPCGFAARTIAAEHCFAVDVLDAVDIDFDFVADLQVSLLARRCEFAKRHAAFRLQTDVDDGHVVLDAGHGAMHHAALEAVGVAERFVQHRREIVAGRHYLGCHRIQ